MRVATRSAVLFAAVLSVASGAGLETAAAEGDGLEHAGPVEPARLAAGGAMRLGLPADRWSTEVSIAVAPKRRDRCQRWSTAAAGLGETFAGHALRELLIARHCVLIQPAVASLAWDWPWSGLDSGEAMPPRLHRAIGAWQIRCGSGASDKRCALLQVASAAERGGDGDELTLGQLAPISTHFVIDRVGGREVMLWRLFVPRWQRGVAGGATGRETVSDIDRIETSLDGDGGDVRFSIGQKRHAERFTTCASAGCIMEVGAARAGRVATGLAAGLALVLEIEEPAEPPLAIEISAVGFAEGLKELIRLRHAERQPSLAR